MDREINTSQIEKIKSPLFVIGLVTLLVNDLYAKYTFSNEITGKLSDIAGLFIFPYFFSALKPQSARVIYYLTGLAFTFWKLPVSQPFFDFCNSIGIGFNRTIDYSDLLVLFILPLSFRYFRSRICKGINPRSFTVALLALLSIFSFCATTLPKRAVTIQADVDKAFVFEFNKEELFNRMSPGLNSSNDTIPKNLNDSLYYLYFDIPDFKARLTVLSSIQELKSGQATIKLDSIVECSVTGGLFLGFDQDNIDELEGLIAEDFENYFEKNFIEKIKINFKNNDLHYDNKKLYDNYMKDRYWQK